MEDTQARALAANGWLPADRVWRKARANRFTPLMENAAYFEALEAALARARRSVIVLGWQFDPRTRLDPHSRIGDRQAEIGHRLRWMIKENPELDVRLLIWRSPLLIAASQGFFPQRAQRWFKKRIAEFRLDTPGPLGACHHQKVVVIDDKLAFVGGGDISVDRWDSEEHLDGDPRRCLPSGLICSPRHEVMAMFDGPAAHALGDLARIRWYRATGERVRLSDAPSDPWPEAIAPMLTDVEVGVARTMPRWRRRHGADESLRLHLDGIARAKRLIYLENQYVTSPRIAEALAARLAEPEGPEVVIVTTLKAPSWFDQMTMDTARAEVLHALEQADVNNRLTAWAPVTEEGGRIIVHSKVTIIDDQLLRIGSSNLNNRSFGYDSECDVAAAPGPEGEATIRAFRHRLIGHFLGVDAETYASCEALSHSVGEAIATYGQTRMVQLGMEGASRFERMVAEFQLGDPNSPADDFRPWKRRRRMKAASQAIENSITNGK
ncbi:phospholipase D-like domain-containing protein [Brevundimonas lutea]|uniref:phospholipase D-like domain-containing protein n=1 Tax=Brevundimonas lutea TaxID=2293980 RepID=UPI001F0BE0FC|nr:phospholipase D-like domain-containing protein [Brevundimonas lutea]